METLTCAGRQMKQGHADLENPKNRTEQAVQPTQPLRHFPWKTLFGLGLSLPSLAEINVGVLKFARVIVLDELV